jgi:hypothetical protein
VQVWLGRRDGRAWHNAGDGFHARRLQGHVQCSDVIPRVSIRHAAVRKNKLNTQRIYPSFLRAMLWIVIFKCARVAACVCRVSSVFNFWNFSGCRSSCISRTCRCGYMSFLRHVDPGNRIFAKTGSGQTQEKSKKRHTFAGPDPSQHDQD